MTEQNNPDKINLNPDGEIVDGKEVWTEAKPIPLYKDGRPWYIKIWHLLQPWKDSDDLMEPWWIKQND